MLTAHFLEQFGLFVEAAHRVAAEQCKAMADRELVPEYFEPDRRGGTAFLPEHVHHFSVRADDRAGPIPELGGNQLADVLSEKHGVRVVAFHKRVERLLSVDEHEVAPLLRLVDIDEPRGQLRLDGFAMAFGRDDDSWMAADEALTEKTGHG